ncbi:MAG: hypothetical protein EOO54_07110 [Haliea sp.]|nr:MAG: hypothetical protein EOO54_07110 [Haliea sp.]
MTQMPAALPQRQPTPIDQARDKTEEVQQELEIAGAELHLTNTALDRHLPDNVLHGDVERALSQNAAVEGKVQEAAQDLEAVTNLLEQEKAERERLERELAAATGAPAGTSRSAPG